MYDTITMRDKTGDIIGFIWRYSNGREEARDRTGRLLGYYEYGTTRTADGRVFAQGNALGMLFR